MLKINLNATSQNQFKIIGLNVVNFNCIVYLFFCLSDLQLK